MVWCVNFFLLGNRVSKARFTNQKNLSPSLSYKPRFCSKLSLQPKNNRERDWDSGLLGEDRKEPRSCAAWARPGSFKAFTAAKKKTKREIEIQIWLEKIRKSARPRRGLGLDLFSLFFFFFFSMFSEVLSSSLRYIKVINQVLETRFPCGFHVEKYATLDVIRPWKSSLWNSIYRPKSSLKDSRCK